MYAVLNGTIHMRCLALNTCQLVSKILVAMFANLLEVLAKAMVRSVYRLSEPTRAQAFQAWSLIGRSCHC